MIRITPTHGIGKRLYSRAGSKHVSTTETQGAGRQEQLRADFEALYIQHFDRLYDFCLRTVADPEAARDAVQETFARAWQERQRGVEIVYPKAWLFRVARNVCIDEIRRRKGSAASGLAGEEAMFAVPDAERQVNPETATVDGELRGLVWSAARGLGARDYSLLDMHLRQELSIEEIAGALGAKPGAVYTMLSRMRDAVESAVGAEVLRRSGECETLAGLVRGRELDRKLRSEIDAHVRSCATCSERRQTLVSPAAIFAGFAPVAAPDGLRESILRSGQLFAKGRGAGRLAGGSRGRLFVLAATAVGAVAVVAVVLAIRSGSADAGAVNSGYVLLGGSYVEPPYSVETRDGEVRLNGQTVWRQEAPPVQNTTATGTPGDARAAVDAAGVWLSEHRGKNETWVSDGLAGELKRYIQGLPPVASVEDDGFTLTVTDRDGESAELAYRSMVPVAGDTRQRAESEARRLMTALKAGDVVLISAGVMMDVPAGTSMGFLGMIAGSLGLTSRDAQAERLARILPPAITEDLVAVGSPEAALRRRLPGLVAQEPPVPQQETTAPVLAGPTNGRAAFDLTAFPDGHVPGSDNAIFWLVLDETSTALEPVRTAVSLHEYRQITFDRNWVFGNARKLQASQFVWALAHAGVFYISAHGSPTGIEIDRYWCEKPSVFCPGGSVEEALAELRKTVPAEVTEVPASAFSPARTRTREIGSVERSLNGGLGDVEFPKSWGIWINPHEIELVSREAMKQGAARNILLELSACSSIDLAPHFLTADDVVAGAETLIIAGQGWREDDMADFNTQFWPRMSGVLGQGSKRWVEAAFNDTPKTKYARHGSGLTMLSPVVTAETPDRGATIPVGVEIPVTVRFATKMDRRFADAQINLTVVEGDCKPEKTDFERWLDDRTLTFHIIARKEGTMLVRVKGAAESGENFVRLDGNSATDGAPSGVGANTDDFAWRLNCRNGVQEAPGQAVSPTPSSTVPPGNASASATASRSATADAATPSDGIQRPTQPPGGTSGSTTTPGSSSATPTDTTPAVTPSPTEATSTTPPPPTATTPAPPLVTGPYAGSVTVPPGGDPAGHSCCVKPSSAWDVRQVRDTSTNVITITLSGVLPGISLSSSISGTGAAFTATSTGVVAGFANVSVTFSGSVTPQTGIQGTLVVGGNGALPQGKSITFSVNMAKQ